MLHAVVSDSRSSHTGEERVPGVMLAVQTFWVVCNPLVRPANCLGFQNLTLRSSFGDLAFPHVFWRRGRGLRSSLQVAAWLWPWLFCSQLWDLLSRKRWVAHVWSRAAGWLHFQMDALHWASLTCNVLYTLLYLYHFMSIIPSVSSFPHSSLSLCPSASLPLTTHLSPASAHLGSFLLLCCTSQPFLQLTPPAMASPSFPICCNCPIQIFDDSVCFYANISAKQISCLGREGRESI